MGWSSIVTQRTTQTGSLQSQVVTGVNLAVDSSTGYIDAALSWPAVAAGHAFAVVRAGVVTSVRCAASASTTRLTYYRLYTDIGTEITTDIQVGDTIEICEHPESVGAGSALSAVVGITATSIGTSPRTLRTYAVGANGFIISGYTQLPPQHVLTFSGEPGQTIRIDAGGVYVVGSYATVGGKTTFDGQLGIHAATQGPNTNLADSLINPNTATSSFHWFAGAIVCGRNPMCDVAGATTVVYSDLCLSRMLGIATSLDFFQWRPASANFRTYSFTCHGGELILLAVCSIDGYKPKQQNLALTFSSGSSPSNVWLTLAGANLNGGNVVDAAFFGRRWLRLINHASGSNYIARGQRMTVNNLNAGLHEVRQRIVATVKNVAGADINGARVFCRDTNNGLRIAANIFYSNPDYISDRTYEGTLSGGTLAFNTDGGVLTAVRYENPSGLAITGDQLLYNDYRSIDNSNTDRFQFAFAYYGYEPGVSIVTLKGQTDTSVSYPMLTDLGVTASRATAATYSDRFSIASNGNITVTANATLDQLYDYAAYWLDQSGANMEAAGLGSKLISFSGRSVSTVKDIIVNVGATLSSGAKYNSVSTTGTLTINGSMGVSSYTSPAGTLVGISVSPLVAGSRIQVYNVTDDSEIYNGVVAGTSYFQYVTYTSDKQIRLRAAYVNGLSAKQEVSTLGTLTDAGVDLLVAQLPCLIYEGNGIDGSTVTGLTLDVPNIEIDADEVDNAMTVQEMYAWYKNELMTDDGIRTIFGAITPESAHKYRINTAISSIKIDQKDMVNSLVLSGGLLYRDDGTAVRLAGSGVIEFVVNEVYESSAAEQILTAIKVKTDSLTFTTAGQVDANIQYVNDVLVKGVGTDLDPWNPAP